jgi:Uma2 family endonuclease
LLEAEKLKNAPYTYGDLKNFPEDEKWELINGVPYLQAQPAIVHQEIAAEILTQIRTYLRGKPCRVIPEPAVWLHEMTDSTKDYMIPDIAIICDSNKIVTEGIVGAPDMIIEIVSPSNAYLDRNKKLRAYRLAGVKEYWIVEPEDKYISVFTLNNDFYRIDTFSEGKVKVGIFKDLEIDLGLVFPDPVTDENK